MAVDMAQGLRDSAWKAPPQTLRLGEDEVHVWRASLDRGASQIDAWEQILSAEERERAGRFIFRPDRANFIVAHGVLRAVLGRYLNEEPRDLMFCTNEYGKPALEGQSGGNGLRFNLSHSSSIALYAIARGREIGVDVERIRPFEHETLAEQIFSTSEMELLRSQPPELRLAAFYACWTRKEAYVKARGNGLSSAVDDYSEDSRWSLRELDPGPGYVAALAVERGDVRLECWDWV